MQLAKRLVNVQDWLALQAFAWVISKDLDPGPIKSYTERAEFFYQQSIYQDSSSQLKRALNEKQQASHPCIYLASDHCLQKASPLKSDVDNNLMCDKQAARGAREATLRRQSTQLRADIARLQGQPAPALPLEDRLQRYAHHNTSYASHLQPRLCSSSYSVLLSRSRIVCASKSICKALVSFLGLLHCSFG